MIGPCWRAVNPKPNLHVGTSVMLSKGPRLDCSEWEAFVLPTHFDLVPAFTRKAGKEETATDSFYASQLNALQQTQRGRSRSLSDRLCPCLYFAKLLLFKKKSSKRREAAGD